MTREIKFRAWCIPEKEMYGVMSVEDLAGGTKVLGTGIYIGNGWARVNDKFKDKLEKQVELMQYTGLKDKNGVEVFEGDITKQKNRSRRYIVRYIIDGWCLDAGETPRLHDYIFEHGNIEVIGNIYQNPELLES